MATTFQCIHKKTIDFGYLVSEMKELVSDGKKPRRKSILGKKHKDTLICLSVG